MMKQHVTFVNPPSPGGAVGHLPFALVGLGYLAAVLENNNYEVDVIDCQALKLTIEQAKEELSKRQPTIVGITSTTLTYKNAQQIAKAAKQALPNSITIIGGPHVTFWDQQALQENPQLNRVVQA